MVKTDVQQIKQRFGIIGHNPNLDRAIDVALQVAPTDLSVLITGESGVGKETFPQIIHQNSARKHGQYIAVNCGAIPEGTIDSELFGHEKGSFTGALADRKGYFEVADGGTIFLDEVGELPIPTQARLLRVLESGEFIKVGSSKVLKTNVRIVAATNVNLVQAVGEGKFREDLYYRLNTVPIQIPPLRERGAEDILLLFRKFAGDCAEKYRMPAIRLDDEAKNLLVAYRWPGNVRELKNLTERISVIEEDRDLTGPVLRQYLPDLNMEKLPVLVRQDPDQKIFNSEREILYQVLFDMKKDVTELKKLVHDIMTGSHPLVPEEDPGYSHPINARPMPMEPHIQEAEDVVEETLSLEDVEKEMIRKALERHNGRRKNAAADLKISERTLYRKIKEYELE
ncbi:sigma-54 dependent transcriptional regulator [Parabacteroides sp. PF5-6]|uniref:sigma-54 interaction domain-containing protein n=1 Tax=Parabacteroides sp. PF5-6 TaxID=1742403 RepID=UPI0024066BB0|nr:sigma-54 dependent transcriptional regulator [Parabacteroides sp. PF5-6]MDF9831685.1 transcriptional regulator with PAS, ATPase and Fis domain [Parabacteroides sp. PF5-6]